MTAATARRRFLLLRGLRWLPTGLIIPVLVLLLLQRGLSLAQIGLVVAAQGVVVMLLELPTGGLADTLGRRPVLAVAAAVELAATGLLVVADTMPLLVGVFALQGVYRALESGPLDAWYVDTAQAADADADIEGGLAAAGVVTGLAIGLGTLASSGLVALDPLPLIGPLVTPLLAALLLRVVDLGMILGLLQEVRPADVTRLGQSMRGLPTVVGEAVRMVRGSHVLLALLAVELLWAAGMVAFETFTPARLEAVTGSAGRAASLLGPAHAIAWLAAAGGAAAVPAMTRRLGTAWTGAALRIGQGLAVVGIGLLAGPVGVIAAFVTTMAVHGASNPVHQGMLHRAVIGPQRRATVVSANSLIGHVGNAIAGIALGALADGTTLTTAILVGAGLLAIAAPLYLLAGRRLPIRDLPPLDIAPAAEEPAPPRLTAADVPARRRD